MTIPPICPESSTCDLGSKKLRNVIGIIKIKMATLLEIYFLLNKPFFIDDWNMCKEINDF